LDGLAGVKTALARIDECVGKLRELSGTPSTSSAGKVGVQASACSADTLKRELQPAEPLLANFTAALADDLNVAAAWAVVFDWVRETNKRIADNSFSASEAASALAAWEKVDSVLGISVKTETEIPAEIQALAEARTAAKKAKDFKKSDAIRDELKAKGWVIEDTPKGIKLKKI
jgi:cysteinyl-tRNA synthetase